MATPVVAGERGRRPRGVLRVRAQQTDLRLGIEADFVPGREDAPPTCSRRCDFDYVVGSVHFLGDRASTWTSTACGDRAASAEEVWRRYFQTLGEAAAAACSTSSPTQTSSRCGARSARGPRATCGATTSWRSTGSPSRASPWRCRPRGCGSASREIYPAPGVPGDVRRGRRAGRALQRRPPARGRRRRLRAGARVAGGVGVRELCVFERRYRRLDRSARTRRWPAGPGEPGDALADRYRL